MAAAIPAVNLLTINLNDAAWARVLTAVRDGGLALAAPVTLAALHDYIRGIVLPVGAADPFVIHPADWALMPAWAQGTPAQRPVLARVRFLSLANIISLEVTSRPLSTTAPWTLVAKVIGALGPVGTQAARALEASQLQTTAANIRRHSVGGAEDGALAGSLRSDLLRASLPKFLKAHAATPAEQGEELSDAYAYKISELDRSSVEQKRFDLIHPW